MVGNTLSLLDSPKTAAVTFEKLFCVFDLRNMNSGCATLS